MSNIIIKNISAADLDFEKAKDIRYNVFILEQKVDPAEEYDEFELTANHLLAFINDKAVGTCRYRKTEKGFKIERFAVLKEYRLRGVGAKMLEICLDQLPTDQKIYLHAQLEAMPLYIKHNFVPYGELFYECNIAHYAMQYHPIIDLTKS